MEQKRLVYYTFRFNQEIGKYKHMNLKRCKATVFSDEFDGFFTWPNPPQPHYVIGAYLASNRNECQISSWWINGGQRIQLPTSPPSASQLSRKCAKSDVSERYATPQPITWIVSPVFRP
jgi:hypothetical protein